jgi:integrase/recombinase XerD
LAKRENKVKVHDYDYQIERTLALLERDLSLENFEIVKRYDVEMVKSALGKGTRHKNLKMILGLSRLLNKNWQQATKDDIDDLVYQIMKKYGGDSGEETNTTWDFKKILKIFVRWVKLGSRSKDEVGDPPETKSVKIRKVKDKIVREDLVTQEDLQNLLYACGGNLRDKAFLACHYEAGTRPGEILSLLIKHVKFDTEGAVIHVDGKTGPRPIRLIESVPYLAAWIDSHPYKKDGNSPLWINIGPKSFGTPMTYGAARNMVARRSQLADLSKKITMYLFRHSEATRTANFLTEAQLRKRHGWSADSAMTARYVHLVDADVDKAIFEHYGIKKQEETKSYFPKDCHFCQTSNPNDGTICSKCGKPLNLQIAIEQEEKQNGIFEAMKEEKTLLLDEISRLRQSHEIILGEFKKLKKVYPFQNVR